MYPPISTKLLRRPKIHRDRDVKEGALCMHGEVVIELCTPCTRLRIDGHMSERQLLRPRDKWEALGLWQTQDSAELLG